VTFALSIPAGWTASEVIAPPQGQVPTGTAVWAQWQVTPVDASPGTAPLLAQAAYTAQGHRGVTSGRIRVLAISATLADAFNNAGISSDSSLPAADFDGAGSSYSEQALAAAALGPGAVIAHDGITFTWPDVPIGQLDNVVAVGQTVLLSGSGTTLGFIGVGTPGSVSGAGIVHYTDGSTSSFQVTLASYLDAPGAGNDIIAALPYLNGINPAATGSAAVRREQTAYVFYAGVPISPAKTVQAVTLPSGGSIPASGPVTGMHIFALGIGPLPAEGMPLSGVSS
jgi:hypothetical protein